MKLIRTIYKKIGITGVIVITVFITLYSYMYYEKRKRINDAGYSNGVIFSRTKGAKGNLSMNYSFEANGGKYEGRLDVFECYEYNCCSVGDSVVVRYEVGNPANNDLVKSWPEKEDSPR